MKKNSKAGFTLVELMVVAIIVAILAAVAIPLMSANRTRAMATEAEAGLGTIRTVLRAMFAETGAYNVDLNGDDIDSSDPTDLPGLNPGDLDGRPGDLDGRYFDGSAYTMSLAADTYTLTATGDDSTAPQAADVAGVVITLNQDGDFNRTGL